MKQYLIPKDCKTGKVQGNPKIHKSGNPLRLVVNGRHHPTEKLAVIVEGELDENVKKLPALSKTQPPFLISYKVCNNPYNREPLCFV